jgi:glycosyltransferase involved in cell wall biosynthesis
LDLDWNKIILFVGSLFPIKGPQILLHAIPEVLKKRNDILFIFVGGGNIDEYMHSPKNTM